MVRDLSRGCLVPAVGPAAVGPEEVSSYSREAVNAYHFPAVAAVPDPKREKRKTKGVTRVGYSRGGKNPGKSLDIRPGVYPFFFVSTCVLTNRFVCTMDEKTKVI